MNISDLTTDGDNISFTNPDTSTYDRMIITRLKTDSGSFCSNDSNVNNKTNTITLPDGTTNKVTYKFSSWFSGDWAANESVVGTKENGYSDANRKAHDQGFGAKLTIEFTLNADGMNEDGTPQTFDFSGDDDLWVFVDNNLVLDLGGAHAATTGSINFNTKTVTASNTEAIAGTRNGSFATGFNTNPNYVHTMTIYYLERGMFESNLKFGFSFHALPNTFWVDKKIRTKEIIKAGFYTDNGKTGTASNKNAAMSASEGRFISNFEKSYQDEGFTVEQKIGDNLASLSLIPTNIKYTVDNDDTEYYTGSDGKYPIYHDLNDCFVAQFDRGKVFSLKEIIDTANNKYVYEPKFSVWDKANNDKPLPDLAGNNTNGYTFTYTETTTVSGIENLNIKARFENFMQAHTLTLKKEFTNTADTTTEYTLQVLFDFDYDGESGFDQYIAYPLYNTVDGQSQYTEDGVQKPYQLSSTGTLKIKSGQVIEIEEIPENAKIQVKELLTPTLSTEKRYDSITLDKGGVAVEPDATVTKGIQFKMGNDDMTATVLNKLPNCTYSIKYKYPSYDNLYGQQYYEVKGVFTSKEKETYLSLSDGNFVFTSDALKRNFVNLKAPYEDNFMQTLDFSSSSIVDTGTGLGWDGDDYKCEVTADATTNNSVNVSFNLPYAVISSTYSDGSTTFLVPYTNATTGLVDKITAVTQGTREINCFDWYVTAGKKNATDSSTEVAPVYVKAPLIIYNSETPYYFQYWSVKKAACYGMSETEYTRCYDYEFNLSLFMDCVIEPIYKNTWAQSSGNPNPPSTYDMYERFDPEVQIAADSGDRISVAFLENSRNQYTKGGNGTRTAAAADVIYSDFLLTYNCKDASGNLITLKDLPSNQKKAGLVIQAVDYLDNTKGYFDTSIDYKDVVAYQDNDDNVNAIKAWIGRTGNKPTGCAKSEFDANSVDNKNCLQYYYALNNRKLDASDQLLNTMQNRYKVFRAYAYIGDVSGANLTNVQISEPIYFTIYDMASLGYTRP